MNEPIRHHFIPQFILRNFCFNSHCNVRYYCKKTNSESIANTRDVFMKKNLYRDEINYPTNPTKLEHDFADLECEVSRIINNKLLFDDNIILNTEEDYKLRLFFTLMGYRSERMFTKFERELCQSSKDFFSLYQKNGNFLDFWKRNLEKIIKCRSIEEIFNHPQIDYPIKVFFRRDTIGYFGRYFVIVESCEDKTFIIGDTYPIVVRGILPNGLPLELYSIFPLSPKRTLMMVCRGADETPRQVLGFRKTVLTIPTINEDGTYTVRKKRFFNEEVELINNMIFKEAQAGIVYLPQNAQ